jgi:hypothetical protein
MRHRQFYAVNGMEIPVSGGLKVWRFEIVAGSTATLAEDPVTIEGFDARRAAFTAMVFNWIHGFELVDGEVCGLGRVGSRHGKALSMRGRGGFVTGRCGETFWPLCSGHPEIPGASCVRVPRMAHDQVVGGRRARRVGTQQSVCG